MIIYRKQLFFPPKTSKGGEKMDFVSRFSLAILVKIVQTILISAFLFLVLMSCTGVITTDWFADLKTAINTKVYMDTFQVLGIFLFIYALWVLLYLMIVGIFSQMRDIVLLIFSIWHFGLPLFLIILFTNLY